MKTLVKFLFFLACLGFVVTCSKSDDVYDEMSDVELKSAQPHEVTVPFEANLLGEPSYGLDEYCMDEGYPVRVIVKATGNATHMGKVSLTFNFCAGGPADPGIVGSTMTYTGGIIDVHAANGDVLSLSFPGGSIMDGRLEHHPEHVYDYWGGTMKVLGGIGKFEGAEGELTEDDYSSTLDDYTHHRFYGEITLVKGKR